MTPATLEEAASLVGDLARAKKRMLFVGAKTKLRPGPPVDVEVSTTKLARLVEYAPSDQVVNVEAGMPLAMLQAELRKNGQRLAIDPPFADRATIGGIVAGGSYGPRRARFGAVRDLIIGATMVRADGVIARGGGKVVKNVAGFDVPKLLCGSFGTLGLIARVTFRVYPLPETSTVLRASSLTPAAVIALVQRIRDAQLEPAALLAVRTAPGRFDLDVLFEGFEAGVKQQAAKLPELARVDDGAFRAHSAAREAGDLRLKVAALPTSLPEVDAIIHGPLHWYPTLGIGFAGGEVEPARSRLHALGGSLVVERGTGDAFGPPPVSLQLHRAVKQRFDPERLLAPGRFLGGL